MPDATKGVEQREQLHYSGHNSVNFWKRINSLPQPAQGILYNMGCALQDFESRLLTELLEAEGS